MKIIFKPGIYPTPRLALNHEKLEKVFLSHKKVIGTFSDDFNHFSNINAYAIFNSSKNEIVAYSYDDFNYFMWILFNINKEISFSLEDNNSEIDLSKYKMLSKG